MESRALACATATATPRSILRLPRAAAPVMPGTVVPPAISTRVTRSPRRACVAGSVHRQPQARCVHAPAPPATMVRVASFPSATAGMPPLTVAVRGPRRCRSSAERESAAAIAMKGTADVCARIHRAPVSAPTTAVEMVFPWPTVRAVAARVKQDTLATGARTHRAPPRRRRRCALAQERLP
jgi:hypothetical protein